MNLINFLVRLSLVTYLSINAWNTLQNVTESSSLLTKRYQQFQETIQARTSLNFHPYVSHQLVSKNAEILTKGLAYAVLGFGAASLLVCKGFAIFLGMVYFLEQLVVLNFAKVNLLTTLDEFREISFAFLVLFVCFCVAWCGKGKSCTRNPTPSKPERKRNEKEEKKTTPPPPVHQTNSKAQLNKKRGH